MSSEAIAAMPANIVEAEAALKSEPTSAAGDAGLPRRRLDCIDFLRGLACGWVMLSHSLEHNMISAHGSFWFRGLVAIADAGWLGVSLFLVLSGFCLYYPIVSRLGVAKGRVDIKTFAIRRLHRIMPPYLISLTLFSICGLLSRRGSHFWSSVESVSRKDFVAHVFMVHNLSAATLAKINGAYWSLALEFQLYIVFPLFVALAARRSLRTVAVVTLLISLLWQSVVFHHLGFSLDWTPQLAASYHALPARCFEFVMGMVAAAWVSAPKPNQARTAALAVGVLVLPALWFVMFVSRYGIGCDQVWGAIFAGVVTLLARLPNSIFEQRVFLKAIVWLGTISYSVYLLHQPFISLFSPESAHLNMRSELWISLFTVIRLTVITGIGFVFYQLCEKPFLNKARSQRVSV